MKKTATFVKQQNGNGEGRVYRLEPPLIEDEYYWNALGPLTPHYTTCKYVWVSATWVLLSGPETYIFSCDETGKVLNCSELLGSYRGGLDHEKALRGAGYKVVNYTPTPTQSFTNWLNAQRLGG